MTDYLPSGNRLLMLAVLKPATHKYLFSLKLTPLPRPPIARVPAKINEKKIFFSTLLLSSNYDSLKFAINADLTVPLLKKKGDQNSKGPFVRVQ